MRQETRVTSVNSDSEPKGQDTESPCPGILAMGAFLGLEADPASAHYEILPVPYEGTVSYKTGTANGPQAITEASQHIEFLDQELNEEFHHAGIITHSPVPASSDPGQQMKRIRSAAEPILRSGKVLLALGGEHSITVPLVTAASKLHGPISVLQIDAHADLRDTYLGNKHSHACVMRRVLEVTDRICQVGIRSFSNEEAHQCPTQAGRFITPEMIAREDDWISKALDLLSERVYITIDMDGLDPSIAPGVGTPEPNGLNWQQITSLLRHVCTEREVVAADIVEVRPILDNHVTEFLAAKLACKLIAYAQHC